MVISVKVRCVIVAVYNNKTNMMVNPEYYNRPVKEVVCNLNEPLKVFFEKGGFFVHQVVKKEPAEDDRGFWIETSTKIWRFDYI